MSPDRSLPLFRCTSRFEYENVAKPSAPVRESTTAFRKAYAPFRPFRGLSCGLLFILAIHMYGTTSWFTVRESSRRKLITDLLLNDSRDISRYTTSPRVRLVGIFANRFNHPWNVPYRVRLLTPDESRNRFLYSPLRAKASDGIGHGFGIMNGEVGIAIRLGLTYTHRVASYGSLTLEDPLQVENLYGWGAGEIPRTCISDTFCDTEDEGIETECPICESLRVNSTFPEIKVERIVQIPRTLVYGRPRCHQLSPQDRQAVCIDPIWRFIRKNNVPNTLFQLPISTCRSSPVDSLFDAESRNYFFHKYWDLHSGRPARRRRKPDRKEGSLPRLPVLNGRSDLAFPEHELVIAVHARRGDFFQNKREMVSCEVFALVIRECMRVVKGYGGIFSKLAVSVHVYSEGSSVEDMSEIGHVVDMLTKTFMDADGSVRDAGWIKGMIEGSLGGSEGYDGSLFDHGLRVELHVSTDTVLAIHEMIAADIFIGSDSAMGKYGVAMLSRGGLQLLPVSLQYLEREGSTVAFGMEKGDIAEIGKVGRLWAAYAEANKLSVTRAHFMRKVGLRGRKSTQG